jgi:hypothetical protein
MSKSRTSTINRATMGFYDHFRPRHAAKTGSRDNDALRSSAHPAFYFGVGVGIGVGIEKVLFDPDPDPDSIHLSKVHNQENQ